MSSATSGPPPPPPWMPANLPSSSPPAYYNQSLKSAAACVPQMDLMMDDWCDEDDEWCDIEEERCEMMIESKECEDDNAIDNYDFELIKSNEECEEKVLSLIYFTYHNFRKLLIRPLILTSHQINKSLRY